MKRITSFLLSLLLLLAALLPASAEEALPILRIHQIYIGCATGYLLTVEDTVLIIDAGIDTDAGGTNTALLNYLSASGIDHMDAHIVTHYHNDHSINMGVLSELYASDDTLVYGPSRELPARFLPLPKGSYRQLKDNDVITIGPLSITCIGPQSADTKGEGNRDSLNFIVKYGEISFLFTGDHVENNMIGRHGDLLQTVNVLFFPHHGLQPFFITEPVLKKYIRRL